MNALIISAVWGVVMMFSGILLKQRSGIRNLAVAGLVLLLVSNILEMSGTVFFKVELKGMIVFDRFALFFDSIIFASALIYLFLSARDMEKVGVNYAEYFALIFFILCGITLVASFKSLLILFLGIEIVSIPLYILTGSEKKNLKSNEASLKYLLLGSFSTAIMLMGIAFVYGATGSFMSAEIIASPGTVSALLIAGMTLLLFSMAFKASVVPFHFWAPDVYDGAPTVFASFMATIVKAASFIAFIRLFNDLFGDMKPEWQLWMAVLTAATLFVGNITAVFQQSVKRMLAYSSVAQAGFMMFSLYAMNTDAVEGLLLYVAAYSLATIGIFAVLNKMSDYTFDGFNGFAKSQPVLAASTTICLLSLAGIPLTAGFLSKFYMLRAAIDTHKNLWLVIFAVVMAAVSVYYYFRLIQAMYFREGNAHEIEVTPVFKWTMVVVAALVILLGIFPNLLLYWFYF
ncbi:MAG: NADH-quinone oxidoreductase subunit F [Sphingobacteriales bacterium UTBCD1]|jgi:NADH-quinone oxidoreductase subunit N|nr:MAG: NADH-quinone oxidoreductase subunit F [Sphingobacteriales bacterium UTBCD1]